MEDFKNGPPSKYLKNSYKHVRETSGEFSIRSADNSHQIEIVDDLFEEVKEARDTNLDTVTS